MNKNIKKIDFFREMNKYLKKTKLEITIFKKLKDYLLNISKNALNVTSIG